MQGFKSEKEFEEKLNKVSQRMCQCDFVEVEGHIAFVACVLEAKGILNSTEHNTIKSMFSISGDIDA